MEQDLNFSTNWNSKLNCQCFTTIRLHNPKKYFPGARFNVYLKGHFKGSAQVIGVKICLLKDVSEYVARLDTGYSAAEFKKIIQTMYKGKPIAWERQLLDFCLLRYIKEGPDLFKLL